MSNIADVRFSIEVLSSEAYRLTCKFQDSEGREVGSRSFVLSQDRAEGQGKPEVGKKEVVSEDIYSYNAAIEGRLSGRKICRKVIRPRDVEDMKKIEAELSPLEGEQRLIVLDFRGRDGYLSVDEARERQWEDAIVNFSKSDEEEADYLGEAKDFLRRHSVNWIFREGMLKGRLLRAFSDDQVEFFERKDSRARGCFCVTAEFLINAFKFGHVVRSDVDQVELDGRDYFSSVDGRSFVPVDRSRVLLPTEYADMYQLPDGLGDRYLSAVSEVFAVQRTAHVSDVFEMSLQRKVAV